MIYPLHEEGKELCMGPFERILVLCNARVIRHKIPRKIYSSCRTVREKLTACMECGTGNALILLKRCSW